MSARRIALLLAATLGLGAGAGYAATLDVASGRLWAGSQTLTKGTCTVTGSANIVDTYVSSSSASTSYGSATTLGVRVGSSQQWTFVRVSLAGCALPATAGADKATLKLVVASVPGTSRTLTVTPVLSSWSGTLTWNQAQSLAYGTPLTTFATGTTTGVTLNIPVTADVDALIRNPNASFGWRISDSSTAFGSTTFSSVESSTAALRPQLAIDYAK